MATNATPAPGVESIRIQKTVFDLESFEDVTLVKEVPFSPVAAIDEALARLGNDSAKLLAVVNDGLRSELRSTERDNSEGYFLADEDGKPSGETFAGIAADNAKVNAVVLAMAKSVFGLNPSMSKEQKRAAKDSAVNLVRTTPAIVEGLRVSAAAK